MTDAVHAVPDTRYRAFISYSHADKRWGDWLHRALETYHVPSRLVGTRTSTGEIPRRLAPIFRDREELSSAADLNAKVNEALRASANLIVICSPRSAASRWVNEEVLEFKRLGRGDRIFCLIVDGEPNASDLPGGESGECFCPALRYQIGGDGDPTDRRAEPIAADARAGKDGKANAKLKLIAGLLDVGFDALRQREQQRRVRRMAWIASFGIAGMLAMSVLAGVAVHERNQAVMQREQAENLVGFMLGNLRDKLEAVSRLDILNDVADHAMAYFEAQHGSGNVGTRTKRAKAFLLLGGVRLGQGKVGEAKQAFAESLKISQSLYGDGHQSPAVAINLIDAQFWLGMAAWQSGKVDDALAHFQAALPVLNTLLDAHPHNQVALKHQAWMLQNIGHIFQAKGETQKAMREYTAQLEVCNKLVATDPHDRDYNRELANANDNIAALLYSQGNLQDAERHYQAERDLLQKLVDQDPRDKDSESALAIAQTFLAQVAEALGRTEVARENLQSALKIGKSALTADPGNNDKTGDLAAYFRRLGRVLRVAGNPNDAAHLMDRAITLYSQMLTTEPSNVRGKSGLALTKLEQARLAWQNGSGSKARELAVEARRIFESLRKAQNYARDASAGLASVDLLLGKIEAARKHPAAANKAWELALDTLHASAEDSRDPDNLSLRAELLTLLGRSDEARPLIARLDAMHYRDPAYVSWRGIDSAANAATGQKSSGARADSNR